MSNELSLWLAWKAYKEIQKLKAEGTGISEENALLLALIL